MQAEDASTSRVTLNHVASRTSMYTGCKSSQSSAFPDNCVWCLSWTESEYRTVPERILKAFFQLILHFSSSRCPRSLLYTSLLGKRRSDQDRRQSNEVWEQHTSGYRVSYLRDQRIEHNAGFAPRDAWKHPKGILAKVSSVGPIPYYKNASAEVRNRPVYYF